MHPSSVQPPSRRPRLGALTLSEQPLPVAPSEEAARIFADGVIAAGALVAWLGTPWPDWIVGLLIGAVVLAGAVRILRLK